MQTQGYPRLVVVIGGILLGALAGLGIGYATWAVRAQGAEAKSKDLQVLLRQTQASLAGALNPFKDTEDAKANPVDQVYVNPLSGLKVNPFAQ